MAQATHGVSIRVDREIYDAARWTAAAENRSISGQIEFWARIGRVALDNPDLPIEFVRDIMISQAQDKALAEPFIPE